MKMYKSMHPRETMCKELHKEMNMNVGPTRLVPANLYLIADTDELQKQVNALENEVHQMARTRSREKWLRGAKRKQR